MVELSADHGEPLFGAIEAGGTKFNCALANERGDIIAEAVFPTLSPSETLPLVRDFFIAGRGRGQLRALGLASFGPVDLDKQSSSYGCITSTPKPGWSNYPIRDYFVNELQVPVAFETDVNGAALGERLAGSAIGCRHFVYVTVGTGIGAGVMVNGQLMQGRAHPEIGHMLIPKAMGDDFSGCCPFHGACLEGLASGTALNKRWKTDPSGLAASHLAWHWQSYYLALMCVNLTLAYGPEKIILGGGVMQQPHLIPMIHAQFKSLINGYAAPEILQNLSEFIVPTNMGGRAGVVGCLFAARGLVAPI